jgi:hypothetical protein
VADETQYWYAARPHRWWGYRRPLTWQGWLFDLGVIGASAAMSPYVRERAHPFTSLGLVFGLIVLTVAVGHWKGEPNSWE